MFKDLGTVKHCEIKGTQRLLGASVHSYYAPYALTCTRLTIQGYILTGCYYHTICFSYTTEFLFDQTLIQDSIISCDVIFCLTIQTTTAWSHSVNLFRNVCKCTPHIGYPVTMKYHFHLSLIVIILDIDVLITVPEDVLGLNCVGPVIGPGQLQRCTTLQRTLLWGFKPE